jgi:hypothetical protein
LPEVVRVDFGCACERFDRQVRCTAQLTHALTYCLGGGALLRHPDGLPRLQSVIYS